MVRAGTERGHEVVVIDSTCLHEHCSHKPQVHYRGEPLEEFDAVIHDIGASVTFYGCAVLRQFEMMGVCRSMNRSPSLLAGQAAFLQLRLASRIGLPVTGFALLPDDID